MITKEKYQRLMEQKINLERERNKLFDVSQKLLRILEEHGIEVNLPELKGIRSQAGVSLIPGGDSVVTDLNYKPFRNDF